jgi:N-methylhydantoinase A
MEGVGMCVEDGFNESEVILIKNVDVRLVGQSYEITVPYDDQIENISEAFDQAHERAYGYSSPISPREIVNVRISAIVKLPKFKMKNLPKGEKEPQSSSIKGVREVYIHNKWIEVKIFDKSLLRDGDIIRGPSIIEQEDTTILIDKGWYGFVQSDGHIILTRIQEEG